MMTADQQSPQPVIASRKPFLCELKPRRPITWCRCGRSKRQPFCDGRSHLGTGFEPLIYRAGDEPEEVLLCGCKHTRTPPFCDGTHSNLPGGYEGDLRTDEERARLRRADPDDSGVKQLDGKCYVVTPTAGDRDPKGDFWMRKIIGPSLGALHQSQFYVELKRGASPIFGAEGSNVILFLSEGTGAVEIAGHVSPVGKSDGVFVRSGESFRILADQKLCAFVSVLPGIDHLQELPAHTANFDTAQPQRVRGVDATQRSEMGPRYFQMLVDKTVGSTSAAQFIGHIPPSRAEMHRHLYEEALIILSGEGMMWTEESCGTVSAGDVIFLPSKQAHSLECTHPAGMDVVGIIHPGDNPGINY